MPARALYSLAGKRVWVAGHKGMVGAALVRNLGRKGCQLVFSPWPGVDLRRQDEVERWLDRERPQAVFLAAGRVGGILANDTRPAQFIHDNLAIATTVIDAAWRSGIEKLLFLGSSCIYPKLASQPIVEEALLTGALEPTNAWYAVAKIAGINLAAGYRRQYGADFISAMPTNLYGPGDNFDLASCHVLPALMRKAHEAKMRGARNLEIWGSGAPRREFLHVDDCAEALVFLMETYASEAHVNVGSGEDMTILELARTVARVVGFEGAITTDPSKPDGTPRKLMSAAKLRALGWAPRIGFEEGLAETYRWYRDEFLGEVRLAS